LEIDKSNIEGFTERAVQMREEEVAVAGALVEEERERITRERVAMTEEFKDKMESLNKKWAEVKCGQRFEEKIESEVFLVGL